MKKSSKLLYMALYPLLQLAMRSYNKGIIKKNSYLYDVNKDALKLINSKTVMCSRSVIIIGQNGL